MFLSILLAVILAAGFPSQDPAGAPRPAAVSGRVIDASTGRPIAGVIVTPAGSAAVTSGAAPIPPRALTNGAGEFVLRDLRKGSLALSAAKNGYADATYNQRRPGGSGQTIPVSDGQRLADIEIRMWRNSAITGTIVDEVGDPAVGVRVQAFPRWFIAGRKRFAPGPTAVTDDRGVYRLANLEPGEYAVGVPSRQTAVPTEVMDVFFAPSGGGSDARRLEVSRELNAIGAAVVPAGSQYAFAARDQTFVLPPGTLVPLQQPGGGPMVYPTLFHPAAANIGEAAVIALRSGDERGSIDLQLRPTTTARLAGTVVARDGPAANVGVRLVPATADDLVAPLDVATTLTTGSGTFAFAAVPPGQYLLHVLRPPREPVNTDSGTRVSVTPGGGVTIGGAVPPAGSTPPRPPPVPLDATLWARLPVSVGQADLDGVVVSLAPGARVSGRVEFDGTAEKPSGAALTGIRINLDPADGSRLAEPTLAFRTGQPDEDGTFRTFGVPPGQYVLRANPPAGWTLKGAFLNGRDLSDAPFELEARDLAGVVLTFTDRASSISGQVRSGQAPDPGAIVIAFPTDDSAWMSRGAFPRRLRIARADLNGAYAITAVVPGEYYIAAIAEESVADAQDPALLQALTRIARQVRVVEGERRTQDLTTAVIR